MQPDVDRMVEFIRAQLHEDEQWALACNRPYEYADEGSKAPETGVHWQWVTGPNWEPVTPDPVTMEFLQGADGAWSANLATAEEWPVSTQLHDQRRTRTMPRTYANSIDEMDPAAAGHIIRHDPARVLRRVAADRRIVDMIEEAERHASDNAEAEAQWWLLAQVGEHMAAAYADHPGYDERWQAV